MNQIRFLQKPKILRNVDISASLINEHNMLRNELHDLKQCQIKYFTTTITATGLLLGFGLSGLYNTPQFLFFLIPLFIILPCWLVFFDKAKTITRIVAYCRLIEFAINNPKQIEYNFRGWENSLAYFRDARKRIFHTNFRIGLMRYIYYSIVGISQLARFKNTHRYWMINWFTFCGLTVLCWYIGISRWPDTVKLNFASFELLWNSSSLGFSCIDFIHIIGVLTILATLYNLYLIGNLLNGMYSYEMDYNLWQVSLSSNQNSEAMLSDKIKHKITLFRHLRLK